MVDERYARWYFGKEALVHSLLLGINVYLLKKRSSDTNILVSANLGRKEIVIDSSLIKWIEADDHYLKIHTTTDSLIKRTTLEKMANELSPQFIRVHRKYLVNKKEVAGKERRNRDEFIILKSGEKIKVGRSYQPLEIIPSAI